MREPVETYRGYKILHQGSWDPLRTWYEAINTQTGVRLTTGNRVEQVRRAIDAYLDRNSPNPDRVKR